MHTIQTVQIDGFNLMILTDTNITNQYYCRNGLGYEFVCLLMSMKVAGDAQGGGCLVVRDRLQGCSIDATRFHGPNMVSLEVITDRNRTPIIVSYSRLPPWNTY